MLNHSRRSFKWNPEVIAAGVVAYRATSPVYLKAFPDTVPALLKLRGEGYKLGVASEGRAVKQWQKLIQLGLEYMYVDSSTRKMGHELLSCHPPAS